MSLYSEYFYSNYINDLLSEDRLISKMLFFESSLAGVQAKHGIIQEKYADMIGICCRSIGIDIHQLKYEINLGGNAVIPLIKQLTKFIKERSPESAKYVHFGATSQDVIDTASSLLIQDYLFWLDEQFYQLEATLIDLTKQHRQTPMIGRTLLQQAKPITFGLKTAKWLSEIRKNKDRITDCKKRTLILTLGGAVGSCNEYISKEVKNALADALILSNSEGVSASSGFTEFACCLGILVGTLSKIAKDISLLMQTEVGEVFEGAAEGKGGSSTMPHKRNPVTCAAILANGIRIPHLVATMLSAMPQEHERSVGLWHAEWETLNDIMRLTAGSVEKTSEVLENLEIDKERMLANLELTKGLIYAENVSLALAAQIGKAQAHELVEKACKTAIYEKKHLKEVLLDMNVALPNLKELFKPEQSIGRSLEIVDEILGMTNLSNDNRVSNKQ